MDNTSSMCLYVKLNWDANRFLSAESEDWVNSASYEEKKEEIWLSPKTKAPTPTEMSKGQSDNTNNARKKFDYKAVVDRVWVQKYVG